MPSPAVSWTAASSWPSGRVLAALALIVTLLLYLNASSASAAAAPLEGTFEGCPLDTAMPTCVQRLEVMHAGGLQVVVIPAWEGTLPSLASYTASAHALGMSVMWETSDPRWWQQPTSSTSMASQVRGFASACGCNDNGDLLSYMVRWLGALPGTYGYYAADDSMLSPGDQAGLATYVATIKRNDPWHTVLISASSPWQAGQFNGIADETAEEIYPVTNRSLLPVSANQGTWDSVAQTASNTQGVASKLHQQSAFILQAFTWGDNIDDGMAIHACSAGEDKWTCYLGLRYPSGAEQLQLRNEVLLHASPSLILWWQFPGTYGQVGNDTYSIYPTGSEAAARWAGLVAAITAPMPWATVAAPPPVVTRPPTPAKPRPKPKPKRHRGAKGHPHTKPHAARKPRGKAASTKHRNVRRPGRRAARR